jgi:ADP-heptose:LPS heptosyltransferase
MKFIKKLKCGTKVLGFRKTYSLPFRFHIPNFAKNYLEQKSLIVRSLKYIKRKLFMIIMAQRLLEIHRILPSHKNILWINISAPSIGDSLMDLSSRVLLVGKKIDLFTDNNNANIYKHDQVFDNVFTKINNVDASNYDLVIIDSFSTSSVYIKAKIVPRTPFVSMFGHYNGPEVNRVLFSFHRLNQLLGYVFTKDEINFSSKASISISKKDINKISDMNLPEKFIVIALGGQWEYRSYNCWHLVIKKLLLKYKELNIVLVGSNNALDILKKIDRNISSLNLLNVVNKLTFSQTAEIIKNSQLLLCCDGGLMHSANAVSTPIVPLFARLTSEMQLTKSNCAFSLFDKKNVNNIPVNDVLQKIEEAFISLNIYPQGE